MLRLCILGMVVSKNSEKIRFTSNHFHRVAAAPIVQQSSQKTPSMNINDGLTIVLLKGSNPQFDDFFAKCRLLTYTG